MEYSSADQRKNSLGSWSSLLLGSLTESRRILQAVMGLAVLAGLFVVSRHNYLLFHGLAELFAVAVAWSVFFLVWNTRHLVRKDALLLLGIAYFFVGFIDLVQTLSYKGMGFFADSLASNHATQLWIAARGMETLSLLLFPLLLDRRIGLWPLLWGYAAVTASILGAVFVWGLFPDCYVEGHGLTAFKIWAEYGFCLALALGIGLLLKRRERLDAEVCRLVVAAMAVSLATELAFTLYSDVYGLSNLIGHLLKIISFFLIYLALVRSAVVRPHETLFRELSESNRRLVTLMGNLPGMAYRCRNTRAWPMLFVSKGCEALTGYDAAALTSDEGVAFADIIHPDDREMVWRVVQEALESGRHFDVEYRIHARDGGLRWVREKGLLVGRDSEDTGLLEGFIGDITDLRHREEELWESEERRRLAVRFVKLGIWEMDLVNETVWCDEACDRLFGNRPVKMRDSRQWWVDRIHPDDRDRVLTSFECAIEGQGDFWSCDYRFRAGSGDYAEIKDCAVIKRGPDGKALRVAGAMLDVTEERRLEAQLHQAQKMEALGRLAGGIAHDFNNILYAMSGFAELLREDLTERVPEALGHVEEIETGIDRAATLVSRMLTFARKDQTVRRPIRLGRVIQEAQEMLRGVLPSSVELNIDLAGAGDTVEGDSVQLHQALLNLCTNAGHAMESQGGGTLSIRVTPNVLIGLAEAASERLEPGEYIKLTIADTGPGIASEHIEKVFDPFSTTKEVRQGSGLGLSILDGVVRAHHGAIKVHSEPGVGTAFEILLPQLAEDVREADESPKETEGRIRGGSERILVVDDEEAVVCMLSTLLLGLGYHVTTRLNGPSAMEAFLASPGDFDLVLTDLTMPRMGGDQLARCVLDIRPDIPVILSTGYGAQFGYREAQALGVRAVLMKPARKSTLAQTVRKVLDEAARAREDE